MSITWRCREVPFKFNLSDRTLFALAVRLQEREIGLGAEIRPAAAPSPPEDPLEPGCEGFLIRALPVESVQPKLRSIQNYWCYVPSQYQRYYIDFQQSFASYQQKFSSKTRSTLNRKLKKYTEHCGGEILWKTYASAKAMPEFFRLARTVSAKTYQEKLLDAGLPDSDSFQAEMKSLADEDRVRGFILFDRERPVSYLYCPVHQQVLVYQYLGYDPDYMDYSVGTLLQWLALESLFEEGRFRLFDFTEGQSEHKRLFATHSVQCANVFFLQKNLRNTFLVVSHNLFERATSKMGEIFGRFGVKPRIKKLLRFLR